MNLDKDAVTAIAALAKAGLDPTVLRIGGVDVPAILINGGIVSLEGFMKQRAYYRGKFSTDSLDNFSAYVNANKGGTGFIDTRNNKLAAQVRFNLGTVDAPGPGNWTGTLTLDYVAAFEAFNALCNPPSRKGHTQEDVIEFIEDWGPLLTVSRTADGDTRADMTLSQAVASIRRITITKGSERVSTQEVNEASLSAFEKVAAKGADQTPNFFTMTTPPCLGLQQRVLVARMAILTGNGDTPILSFRWVSEDAMREEIANEFRDLIVKNVGDSAAMYVGTFEL